jgi:hypothetical protein
MSGAGIQLPPIFLFAARSNIRVSQTSAHHFEHVGGIAELQAEQREQAGVPRLVDHRTLIQVVQEPARLRIQANVPYPALVVDPRDG